MADTRIQPQARRSAVPALLLATRPEQWPKNVLVLAAPAAAGALTDPEVWPAALVTAAAFVLASAATYLVNDTVDRDVDADNPRTAHRPLATGAVRPTTALVAAAALAVAALALVATTTLGAVLLLTTYLALNLAYNLGARAVPLVELLIVASGYVLRAAIGGVATNVPLSSWFLSVASFGALYVVVVKRVSERGSTDHRHVLDAYPDDLLEQVRTLALTATALTYTLWAFETGADGTTGGLDVLVELSVVPFLLGLLRYALVTLRDGGASPEKVVAGDRGLQVIGLAWLATLAVALHG